MKLSVGERRVYALVRKAARSGTRATIDSVALQVDMARSSIANVAKKLGYRGWRDFTEQTVRFFQDAESEQSVAGSVDMVASVLLEYPGQPILIDAIGDAEICQDYMLFRLCEAGLPAMPFSAGVARVVGSRASSDERAVKRKGVLLVVNESGTSLLPSCLRAAEEGLFIIAITASHDTPISKLANVNVVIKNNKTNVSDYKPNYFTAGVLVFLERVLAICGSPSYPRPSSSLI